MPNYRVSIPWIVWLHVEVKAEDVELAEDAAFEVAHLTGYAGNGARGGKLVGTSETNVTIEAADDWADIPPLKVEVNKED